ncbi:hypothetical protein HN51_009681 [Arachis hypogaea]|uniref:IST1-like protein n=1 Tax=Arachis hypogaea TaxID=3818 RepID=A0A445CYC5_ARAHY|nr:IST1-like protein [Arachis hypogaea]XP_029154449.1 IST1-like protein [Arachis hypogaea]QHO44206.1 IST1-like protein [Arachis hypogaea]RYR55941.1 hypothetical protein Ahy_A05g021762 isoform A [Arachis hypogaea]RYR55942.1 hypothetical protein Ahy_A05g021762 isoform B [Arachis hypogaea]
MSMLDSFFKQGFKAAKCKTLLKLTIPRIKLLRNRRDIQLKNMRREIAKLLETGQEATARIRVEHIIREENMMAAQEIIELFCELIAVRLPIIEAQRECPLDLKEAISSVCFAAPRCADLPELLQVQQAFAAKYGKEFLSSATELRPDCGVNRQLIELLSVRAPSPEKKLNLLKEIAVEHEIEWDPAASETEFFKKHEDLLNGPTQFVGSNVPPPEEKQDEESDTARDTFNKEQPDSDSDSDILDFPDVPKVSVQPNANVATAPGVVPPPEVDLRSSSYSGDIPDIRPEQVHEISTIQRDEPQNTSGKMESKQFVPFISPPSLPPGSYSTRHSDSPPPMSNTKTEANVDSLSSSKSEANVDLQDVLAAAHAAAETAERAAAAARSAASLAQVRISELTRKNSEQSPDSSSVNPFYAGGDNQSVTERGHLAKHNSGGTSDGSGGNTPELNQDHFASPDSHSRSPSFPSFDTLKADFDTSLPKNDIVGEKFSAHQPNRLPSLDDDPYFSYPNLFSRQSSNIGSQNHHSDNSRSTHDM